MSTNGTLEERITELEIKLVYQQDLIESLNDTITKQWGDIDRLNKYVRDMTDEIRTLKESGPGEGQEPPPPHY